jgi:hypothetical protein
MDTTEIVPIYMSKALVMSWSVTFSVTHSRVEGKTTSFHSFSYLATLIYGSLGKIKLFDHSCIQVRMC